MASPSPMNSSARTAARIAVIVFFGVIGVSVLRALLTPAEAGESHFDWVVTLRFSIFVGVVAYFSTLVWNLATAAHAQPAVDILSAKISPSDLAKPPMYGFVAMEYYWLVMNRTFVVFVAPEGLYGWMARGPVAASDRAYFEPYRQMLLDEQFMKNHAAIQQLSSLPGGFFFRRSEIASIADDDCKKWGMGPLPHTGTIRVRLLSGVSREFIALGNVNTGRIRHKIVSIMGLKPSQTVWTGLHDEPL